MEEIFRDVKGYEGLYQISNLGNIKSLQKSRRLNKKERLLTPYKNKNGYLWVVLSKDKKLKRYSIHRLVASAFIDNPNNYPQVNHKDENKSNNRVSNLEWCDCKYNNGYGTKKERLSKIKSKPILQYSKQGDFIKRWNNTLEIERELNIYHNLISKCCKGQFKNAGGYVWKYEVINK